MIEGEWIKWDPIDNFSNNIYLKSFIDDENGITLTFTVEGNQNKLIIFNFKDWVLSYRNTDEGDLLKTLSYIREEYGKGFLKQGSFFKVKDSSYVKWFNEENYEAWDVEHYVFATPNDIVEILSTYPPEVKIEEID